MNWSNNPVVAIIRGKRRGATRRAADAARLVDICLGAGVDYFDTADIYSEGASEEALGAALKGPRDRPLIATTATFRGGGGANDVDS